MAKAKTPPPEPAPVRREPLDYPRVRFTELRTVPVALRMGSFKAEMLGYGFIGPEAWWRNYMHRHTHFEICYAFAGRARFTMLGVDYTVRSGDVFIAKPGEDHEIVADEADPLGIYFWSYTLVDTPEPEGKLPRGAASDDEKAEKAETEALDRLLHAFLDSKTWVSRRAPGMGRTLELLTEESVRREPGYVRNVEGLLRKLLVDTARAAVDEPLPGEAVTPRFADPQAALVAQATRYMRDNCGRALTMKEIAAQMNLSERHFARLFRDQAGKTPLEALTQIRLETAQQLLLDKSLPIKEIAERVGYPDVRYFTTVFGRHAGLPPAAFRERGSTSFADPKHDGRKSNKYVRK